mgnify:FL=1
MSNRELPTILKQILEENKKKPEDFFKKIQNLREHKELVIIATGPTVNDYTEEQYSNFFQDKDVFSIKQAFFKFPQYTDLHFFNCCNLPIGENNNYGYEYLAHKPFTIASSNYMHGGGRWSQNQKYEIFFKIPTINQNSLMNKNVDFLCKSKNLEDFLFTKTLSRPCGPGIFFETVLFFAIHLGYKKIYTIGWDYSYSKENYNHFYSMGGGKAKNVRVPAELPQKEIEFVLQFIDFLADWLKNNEIELNIVGNRSIVSNKFKRLLTLKKRINKNDKK